MKLDVLSQNKIYAQRNSLLKKRDKILNEAKELMVRISFLAHRATDAEFKKAMFLETKLGKKIDEYHKLTDELKYKNQIIYEIESRK